MATINGQYIPDNLLTALGFIQQPGIYGSLAPQGGQQRAVQGTPPETQQVQTASGDVDFYGRPIVSEQYPQYFDAYGQPNIQDPRQVAADAGLTVGQIGAGFGPRNASSMTGNVDYPIPNDRGGFFSAEGLYGLQRNPNDPWSWGGVPSIFAAGSNLPSTNNWRLLGMGPGYIERNGNIIDMRAAASYAHGWPVQQAPGGSATAEHGMGGFSVVGLGTGANVGAPNMALNAGYGWPGSITPWRLRGD